MAILITTDDGDQPKLRQRRAGLGPKFGRLLHASMDFPKALADTSCAAESEQRQECLCEYVELEPGFVKGTRRLSLR